MSDFEREEQAFRDALARHATHAPGVPEPVRPGGRGRVVAAVAAVAVAAVLVGTFMVAPALLDRRTQDDGPVTTPTMVYDESQWQWIGLRGLEVRAPVGWGFQREVGRPDCVDPDKPGDVWGVGVPTSPYVTVTAAQQAVPSIGCVPPRPGNPHPAFGDLPYPLWQPHVRLDVVREETSDQPDRTDGQWTFEGWVLARRTFGDVQVTVLSTPGSPDLSGQVFASARTVDTNHDGCATTSPIGDGFPRPEGPDVPAASDVSVIAVCEYVRIPGNTGMQGSWLMTGQEAQDLANAVAEAPAGGGPDKPDDCSSDIWGSSAVVLRFLDADESPLADAYVYTDWCTGNGIATSTGVKTLTAANCLPVFSRPEVVWWGGKKAVGRLCSTQFARSQ